MSCRKYFAVLLCLLAVACGGDEQGRKSFSLLRIGYEAAALFGLRRAAGYVVPWDRMEFPPAKGPRCTCTADELQRFSGAPPEPAA